MGRDGASLEVYCDMHTDGGGWTVFQRRQNGATDFYRGWNDYKNGFGDLNGNCWLGLDYISQLTAKQSSLRIELTNVKGRKAYAKYGKFQVGAEGTKYKLEVSGFSGNAGDSLTYHNNMPFTTKDRDNDGYRYNCAIQHKGAWWFNGCRHSDLNAMHPDKKSSPTTSMTWYHMDRERGTISFSEMKLRRIQ